MNRLRHPVRAIREPFGTAGLIVAMVALVAALGGSALAAKGALTGKQKKEVEKIAKKYAGKPGAAGATGPAGPAGTAGKNGPDGTNGTNGTNGTDGTDGTNGKSVTVSEIPLEEPECEERGGALVKEAGGSGEVEVCNGESGEQGSPWTAGGTLPPGATETGTWAFNASEVNPTIFVPLSFEIPLEPGVFASEGHAHFQTDPDFATFCEGTKPEPEAKPGELCVYYNTSNFGTGLENASFEHFGNAVSSFSGTPSPSGAVLRFIFEGEAGEGAFGFGSWAVTGCSASLPSDNVNHCPEG